MIARIRGSKKSFYCEKCDTLVKKTYNYCPECGNEFDGTVTVITMPKRISRTYNVCGECKWFNGDKMVIGVRCTNPNKNWHSETAPYHYRSTKACRLFKEDKNESMRTE